MVPAGAAGDRSLSHKDYLETLQRPNTNEWHRISDYQKRREIEINRKYHTAEEHEAATKIQKAYRGHRTRRQLDGLTLDPSSRWTEVIREWRYRSATVSRRSPDLARSSSSGRIRAASDVAKLNWRRAAYIAEHAVGGSPRSPQRESNDYLSVESHADAVGETEQAADSMLMDTRYFLEMIDQKHRYGANLLVYHEEWLKSKVNQNFFYWLDFGEGRILDLPGCSREKLDRERIRYLSKDERLNYLTIVDNEGKLRWHKNNELITTSSEHYKDSMNGIVTKEDDRSPSFNDDEVTKQMSESRRFARHLARAHSHGSGSPRSSDSSIASSYVDSDSEIDASTPQSPTKKRKHKPSLKVSPATVLNKLLRSTVKPGTWIYVCDTAGRLYVGIKASGAFQHASFLSGARISSAGSIGIENGQLTYLSPLSGHYRPTTRSFRTFIASLTKQGVDMSAVKVSKAFEVLLGMEVYGKSKKGVKHVLHHDDRKEKARQDERTRLEPTSPPLGGQSQTKLENPSATSLVEQNWEKQHQHRSSLGKIMADLRIRSRSVGDQRNCHGT